MSIRDKYGEMDVPAFHVTGWYDDLSMETQINFIGMSAKSRSEHARRWQKLLIGPWGHGVPRLTDPSFVFGDVDFGPNVKIDFQAMQAKWLDYHVKGVQNGLEQEAPVRIFVMGANVWRDEHEWPLARASATRVLPAQQGHGEHALRRWRAVSTEAPGDRAGRSLSLRPAQSGADVRRPRLAATTRSRAHGSARPARESAARDVLVYSTAPLTEDTEVTGIVEAKLVFSTDVTDTDFFVTLSDVYPDGNAIDITEGASARRASRVAAKSQRCSRRIGGNHTSMKSAGGRATCSSSGHRIRVHITSSNFPRFNRNLNSGKPMAEETEATFASRTR